MGTGDWYRLFAEVEAAGTSPIYERTAHAIADDADVIELIDSLPVAKRQPNLLLAACRYLGAPLGDTTDTLQFINDRWGELSAQMRERSTQTNEPGRIATLLPVFAHLDGPVALIEVGASAGLCLYPDRYCIEYDQRPPIGPPASSVRIAVTTSGPVPIPSRVPEVVWRAGVDLNPLDVRDADDLAWLSACIWPEHIERRDRLVAAAAIAAADPPHLIRGDLVEEIDALIEAAPTGATTVVIHSAVLCYLGPAERAAFVQRIRNHPSALWISNEGPGVIDGLTTNLGPPDGAGSMAFFLVGVAGERALAISDPHGRWLRWADER